MVRGLVPDNDGALSSYISVLLSVIDFDITDSGVETVLVIADVQQHRPDTIQTLKENFIISY